MLLKKHPLALYVFMKAPVNDFVFGQRFTSIFKIVMEFADTTLVFFAALHKVK